MAMPARLAKPFEIYQIKVILTDLPIWRCIQLRRNITLPKLHRILQCVMGWEDAHLHEFAVQKERYGMPSQEDEGPRNPKDERKYKLRDPNVSEGSEFLYTYDFGDNWEHVLLVEKILPPEEGVRYPICLAGARACPPEDVEGIPGYENFLEAIANPDHPERDELLEWIDGEFDPETFDVNEVNQKLRRTS